MNFHPTPIDELTTPSRIFAELERLGGGPIPSLGQNFLTDRPLLTAMVADMGLVDGMAVIEIGSGLGHLTRSLLDRGGRVLAVEKDKRLAGSLAERLGNPPQLEIIHGDVLELPGEKVSAWFGGLQGIVAGNLPYYCSSPILVRLFEDWFPWVLKAGFLLQEEVVDRLVSPPGNRTYGRLSVLAQIFSEVKKVRTVSPNLFIPKPEVSSAWCLFVPKSEIPDISPKEVSKWTAVCFGERRKTLLNNLGRELGKEEARSILEVAGIEGSRRPETLSPEEYVKLIRSLRGEENESVSTDFP